jgi:hypothetical protein
MSNHIIGERFQSPRRRSFNLLLPIPSSRCRPLSDLNSFQYHQLRFFPPREFFPQTRPVLSLFPSQPKCYFQVGPDVISSKSEPTLPVATRKSFPILTRLVIHLSTSTYEFLFAIGTMNPLQNSSQNPYSIPGDRRYTKRQYPY